MKNRLIAGLTLLSFLSLGFPAAALSADAQQEQGQVEASKGKVLYQTDSGWNAVSVGSIAEGSLLRTGGDGETILRFGNSRVRVSANTQLKVVDVNDTGASLLLERGRVLGKADGSLVIETHRTTTQASQGEFVLQTTSTGTELNVLDGDATLKSDSELSNPALDTLPEGVETTELSQLDGLGDIQQEGVVAQTDDGEEEEEDNTLLVAGVAGAVVVVTILLATGGDDDEIVGNPSPNLP